MAGNALLCINNGEYKVNFNDNTPAIGEIWSFDVGDGKLRGCVTIETLIDDPASDAKLTTQYIDCQTCIESNPTYSFYIFTTCQGLKESIFIDSATFGILPNIGNTYFIKYEIVGGKLYEGCFIFSDYKLTDPGQYNELVTRGSIGFTTETPIEETDCQTCLSANTNYYSVLDCATGENIILNFPPGYNPCGRLFTYTDGIDQFCAYKPGFEKCTPLSPPQVAIGDFVADEGEIIAGVNDCDTCLGSVAETRILTNCLTGEVVVVWNSLLNQIGSASNLSSSDGCFEVGPITSATPTLGGFLNFDPQPDCQDCIQCNGVNYEILDCDGETLYNISSYDYHPIGTFIYNPFEDRCGSINNISAGLDYDIVYSLRTYSDCETCQSALKERWFFDYCYRTNSGYYDGIVVTDQGFNSGEVVNLQVGNTDFLCVKLDTTMSGTYSGYYGYASNTTTPYESCSACTSDSTYVGVTLLQCSTNTYGNYRILISDYEEMIGFGPVIPTECISNSEGYCFTMVNTCAITPEITYPIFTPSSKYTNCTNCQRNEYPNVGRSANTENFVCVTCCPCDGSSGSTFSVTPPHPVWTDGYGTSVTQMNMITLGGINGLNG